MSKERLLLVRAKVLLECVDTAPQDQADLIIKDIQELLTKPEPFMFKDRKLTGSLIVHDDMYKKGYAQAELDLKREPFGEERQRLSKAYSTRAEQVAFEEGIIFADKHHGIGGGNEQI